VTAWYGSRWRGVVHAGVGATTSALRNRQPVQVQHHAHDPGPAEEHLHLPAVVSLVVEHVRQQTRQGTVDPHAAAVGVLQRLLEVRVVQPLDERFDAVVHRGARPTELCQIEPLTWSRAQSRTQVALEAGEPYLVGSEDVLEQTGDAAERRRALGQQRLDAHAPARLEESLVGRAVVAGQELEVVSQARHLRYLRAAWRAHGAPI